MEELLVFHYQQLSNGGELALALSDRIELDALNEHLDQRC